MSAARSETPRATSSGEGTSGVTANGCSLLDRLRLESRKTLTTVVRA